MAAAFPIFDVVDTPPVDPTASRLHLAAERGQHKQIMQIVERTIDFDINQLDSSGRTALMWAAENGQIKAAEALLDCGASASAVDMMGRNAVHLAARAGNSAMIDLLLEDRGSEEKDALVNVEDNQGTTPIFLARQKGADGEKAFRMLMQHGATWQSTNANIHAAIASTAALTINSTGESRAAKPDEDDD